MRLGMTVLVVGFLLVGCEWGPIGPSDSASPHKIRYTVTGTAESADVTIRGNEGLVDYECRELPWVREFVRTFSGTLYISAQSCSEDGTICVRIYVNGYVQDSSCGEPPHATAEAGRR